MAIVEQEVISDTRLNELNNSAALYIPDPDIPLTEENKYILNVLDTGFFYGIPISQENIRAAGLPLSHVIGQVPFPSLTNRWRSEPLTGSNIIESFEDIAGSILKARKLDLKGNLIVDPSAAEHIEAQDFSRIEELIRHFFYLENDGLHARRIRMLSDLAVSGIRKTLEVKAKATIVNFGPGLFPLERSIIKELSEEERQKVRIIGIDVSKDILAYGLEERYIDQGIAIDMKKKNAEDYEKILPEADIVVFAEVLEHIDHASVFFANRILPWLRKRNAMLIGSIPNAVQLAEYINMITGINSPHQLRRPIFDDTNDHHSFHTVSSLAEMLTKIWGFREAGIVSNDVRIEANGNRAHLYAGLDCVTGGDRLIFWGIV